MNRIKAKLNRRRDLVDILSARPAGPHERLFDLLLFELDLISYWDHL